MFEEGLWRDTLCDGIVDSFSPASKGSVRKTLRKDVNHSAQRAVSQSGIPDEVSFTYVKSNSWCY